MVKLALLAAVVAAALYGVREERVLEEAGLLGSCDVVQTAAPADGQWLACRNGRVASIIGGSYFISSSARRCA